MGSIRREESRLSSYAESEGTDAAFYTIKERWLARVVVPCEQARSFQVNKRDLFKEGVITLEGLSETTNGDADSVVKNPACQFLKFF
jgi:hypothetical protein